MIEHPFQPRPWPLHKDECDARVDADGQVRQCGRPKSEHGAAPQLPPDVMVEARGQGEERRVHLDIEGTTFELHPDDAAVIGECLVIAAKEAATREGEETPG